MGIENNLAFRHRETCLIIFPTDNDSLALQTFVTGNATGFMIRILPPLIDNVVFAHSSSLQHLICVYKFLPLFFPLMLQRFRNDRNVHE